MKLIRNLKKTAVICDGKEVSYTKLLKQINSYGTLLNLEKGDRVTIFSANRPEFLYSLFAVWDKKGIATPIDSASNADELCYVLKDSSPKYIFTSADKKKIAIRAIEKSGLDIELLIFEEISNKNTSEEVSEMEAPDKEDTVLILYTSGTTGDPKGVMLTFDNILAQIESISKYGIYEESDILLTVLPLYHIFALVVTGILPFYYGSTSVFITELTSDKIKKAFTDYRATIFVGVPKLFSLFHKGIINKIISKKITGFIFELAKKIKSENLRKIIFGKVHRAFGGNIKYFVSGGAKLDGEISKDFYTLGFKILEGYGLTETSPIVTFTKPDNIKPGSAGSPLESIETKISEEGELLVRGRSVMKGYYNKPEKTREAIDKNGWLHTGDLASFDSENYIQITGRKKDMIVLSNGKNIDPLTIENEIMKFGKEFIQEIAVVDHNDRLNALLLPDYEKLGFREHDKIREIIKSSVMDYYNKKSISYKKIVNFKIIHTELPKTRLGKLRRFMLKDLITQQS